MSRSLVSSAKTPIPGETEAAAVVGLIRRLEEGERGNGLDVLIEVALFRPCDTFETIRANNAGTKVIYGYPDGQGRTYWAADWSLRPAETLEHLRERLAALLATEQPGTDERSEGVNT